MTRAQNLFATFALTAAALATGTGCEVTTDEGSGGTTGGCVTSSSDTGGSTSGAVTSSGTGGTTDLACADGAACTAETDCPPSTTACVFDTCTYGCCGTVNAARGRACADGGGVVCDGLGACVATLCTDGVEDGGETDVDCGGTCGGCAGGQKCLVATDCLDLVCDPTAKRCGPGEP